MTSKVPEKVSYGEQDEEYEADLDRCVEFWCSPDGGMDLETKKKGVNHLKASTSSKKSNKSKKKSEKLRDEKTESGFQQYYVTEKERLEDAVERLSRNLKSQTEILEETKTFHQARIQKYKNRTINQRIELNRTQKTIAELKSVIFICNEKRVQLEKENQDLRTSLECSSVIIGSAAAMMESLYEKIKKMETQSRSSDLKDGDISCIICFNMKRCVLFECG